MADSDNLDNLSNVELRKKMIEQGLPNIPVTDSSRKVLVKRLRASIGGNASPVAAAASPKKTNRRDTLAAAAVKTTADIAEAVAQQSNAPPKARRTIAAALGTSKLTSTTIAAEPIRSRRTSNTTNVERPDVASSRAVKQQPTIPENPKEYRTTTSSQNTLLADSFIVLESDDEEDERLAQAVKQVEEQQKPKEKAKLSATITSKHEYVNKPVQNAPLSYGKPLLEQQRRQTDYDQRPAFSSAFPVRQPLGTTYDYAAPTTLSGRYSSFNIRTPSQEPPISISNAPTAYSFHRRSPPRTYTNEFSDDMGDEDRDTKEFASEFTRNLQRSLARERNRNTPFSQRSAAGTQLLGQRPAARPSLRQEETDVSEAFRCWWQSLDRQYNLKSKLFILGVILLLLVIYKIFY